MTDTPVQAQLFVQDSPPGVNEAELFPAVWKAAEGLADQRVEVREEALQSLLAWDAARISPLIAYLFVSRLHEPELRLRMEIVSAIGQVLAPDAKGRLSPEEVRSCLSYHLAQMQKDDVVAILQANTSFGEIDESVFRLLSACPYAGEHLAEILADRMQEYGVRQKAAYLIGRVGFLDAIPTLERLETRLEARQSGQQRMPFAPPAVKDEMELLPAIKEALATLKAI